MGDSKFFFLPYGNENGTATMGISKVAFTILGTLAATRAMETCSSVKTLYHEAECCGGTPSKLTGVQSVVVNTRPASFGALTSTVLTKNLGLNYTFLESFEREFYEMKDLVTVKPETESGSRVLISEDGVQIVTNPSMDQTGAIDYTYAKVEKMSYYGTEGPFMKEGAPLYLMSMIQIFGEYQAEFGGSIEYGYKLKEVVMHQSAEPKVTIPFKETYGDVILNDKTLLLQVIGEIMQFKLPYLQREFNCSIVHNSTIVPFCEAQDFMAGYKKPVKQGMKCFFTYDKHAKTLTFDPPTEPTKKDCSKKYGNAAAVAQVDCGALTIGQIQELSISTWGAAAGQMISMFPTVQSFKEGDFWGSFSELFCLPGTGE